jgi:hypothetical protein
MLDWTRTLMKCPSAGFAAVLACSTAVLWASTKGPDAGGYSATDEIVYSFVDISGASGGTSLLGGTDDGTAVLSLPFVFRFYGQSYSVACVSTNGVLYFVPSASDCGGFEADFANVDITAAPVPNDRPAALPYWSDLTFQVPGAGAIFYQTVGAAPARRFVVQWNNAYPQGASSPVTFQAILTEQTHRILFQYKSVSLGTGDEARRGARATVGIRNTGAPGNNQHLAWSYNAPVLANDSGLAFSSALTDTAGPVVTASAPATIWPPNDKTVDVRVQGTMTDSGSGLNIASARFAVTDEYGAVQPSGPIAVAADGSYTVGVPLLASRLSTDKDGRRYVVVVSVTDVAGNTGSATVVVVVPHDQR